MKLLDRFKTQPKWRDPDPSIRLAAVQALEDDEQELLVAMARDDSDARVRRAAVRKLSDLAALAALGRTDQDETVREYARSRLVGIVLEAESADRAETAFAHVAALGDSRALAAVAKTAALAALRHAAVAQLSDVKDLGSIARHAEDPAIRREALQRISDPSELATIALRSQHRDVALAALERVTAPDALQMIAARGKHKASARRARSRLDEIKQATAPASSDEGGEVKRLLQLCRAAELLAHSTDLTGVEAQFDRLQTEWAEVGPVLNQTLASRFEAACVAIRDRLAELERARVDERRRAEALASNREARIALCAMVESVTGEAAPSRLEEARAAWLRLGPPLGGDIVDSIQRRFERACQDCTRRSERWKETQAARVRMEALCEEAERIADISDLEPAKARWAALRSEWRSGYEHADETLKSRFSSAERRLSDRQAAARREGAQRQQQNAARLERLCAHWETRLQAADLTLKEADHGQREVRAIQENPGPLSNRDGQAILQRLKRLRRAFSSRMRELRETDEWQRWANVSIQEQLCARVEALLEMQNLEDAFRQLREIEHQWKAASAVPRRYAEPLWHRFKAAHDQVRSRCEAYFARQAQERVENLRRREALCQRAEALAESTDWLRTAEQIKQLQREWQTIGPIPRHHTRTMWTRFRTACDRFFSRRVEDLARRKQEWAKNLAHKESLCEQAEALAESTDWEPTAAEIRRLQAEWKTAGPVKKNKSEAIWQRFRTAGDRFFDRYAQREQLALAANLAEREAICRELEMLAAAGDEAQDRTSGARSETGTPISADDIGQQIQVARAHWDQLGPIPRHHAVAFHERLTKAIHRVAARYPASFRGTDLDFETNRRKKERLCSVVESLAPALPAGGASPAAILAVQLRDALAANTIGGRVDEEAKWRAAADEVKKAQAAWKQIGPVPGEAGRALSTRFERACVRFYEQRRVISATRRFASSQPER